MTNYIYAAEQAEKKLKSSQKNIDNAIKKFKSARNYIQTNNTNDAKELLEEVKIIIEKLEKQKNEINDVSISVVKRGKKLQTEEDAKKREQANSGGELA